MLNRLKNLLHLRWAPNIKVNHIKEFGPILIALYALFQTCHNNNIASENREDSKRSADIAQRALELQKQQFEDYLEERKGNRLEDEIKRKVDTALVNNQILALKEQANALKKGVRNTEISQRPYLGVKDFGFHIPNLKYPDSVDLEYSLSNFGVRPALLFRANVVLIDNQFRIISYHPTYGNKSIITDGGFAQRFSIRFNGHRECTICDIKDILKAGDIYFYFMFEYYDPFYSENRIVQSQSLIFKWKKNTRDNLTLSGSNDYIYYPADICTDSIEIINVLKTIKPLGLNKKKSI